MLVDALDDVFCKVSGEVQCEGSFGRLGGWVSWGVEWYHRGSGVGCFKQCCGLRSEVCQVGIDC